MTADLAPIRQRLIELYGPTRTERFLPTLIERIEFHRRRLSPPPIHGPWTEGDAFLIAYPDQVSHPGSPPLVDLEAFCRAAFGHRISGIHLLPFYPWSSDDGFSVTDYRSVDPSYGTWDDVRRIGNAYRLMVDLVLNHASAQGGWFEAFLRDQEPERRYFLVPDPHADWSQVVRPRTSPLFTPFATRDGERLLWTTFGPDQVDLDFHAPEVLLEMVDILLSYVARGAQVVRLDAITYIWKEPGTRCIHLPQGHLLVQLFHAVLDYAAPWARLLTETNVPHEENISYFGDGDEADLVYQFPLPPLVAHTLLSGDARRLSQWAGTLRPPPGRATFLNFLASHDGIGVFPVHEILDGDELASLEHATVGRGGAVSSRSGPDGAKRPYELNINLLDLLTDPRQPSTAVDRFLVAHAIMASLAGVPLFYFHSLVGSRGDLAAAARTGMPRRVNRERLDLAALQTSLQDPASERRRILDGMLHLLDVRRTRPSFNPSAEQEILSLGERVFAVRRGDVLCLHEVGGVRQSLGLPAAFHHAADLRTGERVAGGQIRLDPYQFSWLSGET